MSKFPDSFLTDYRSKYKEKNKRGVSKNSSFQPFFNSDEFYNPVYTESVTSIEQQLEILSTGNAQNATHALNSLSFLLENPLKHVSKNDEVSIGICGNLLYFSFPSLLQMIHSIGWRIELYSKKNQEKYTHILLGVRPDETILAHCTSLSVPLMVEYHCKRYFDRQGMQTVRTDEKEVREFVETILSNPQEEITTSLFAIELFGSSKAIRLQAREYLKEYLSDEQKDSMRLHWFKQPSKYSYNPKFFHDVSKFLETVGMNGQLFQETAYQLTNLPTTQELLASKQATTVLSSLVEEQFRSEFFESISGIVMRNIDALTLQLESLKEIQGVSYLSVQQCEISALTSSNLPSVTHLSLVQMQISEQDFCVLLESLPNLLFLHVADVTIEPSRNSQMYRLKFPQCISISISQLDYQFSHELYKKIITIRSLKKLVLENFSITSTLHSLQLSSTINLEELRIAGFSLTSIRELGIESKKFTTLHLRSTGIKTLDGLENLRSLKSLQISDEILLDVSAIQHCRQLLTLSLRSCSLETIPLEILDCKHLTEVDLSSNSICDVELKGKKSTPLQRLLLSNNQIQSITISHFLQLEYIYLSKNQLTTIPAFVFHPKNKEVTIDLFDNPFDEVEVEKAMELIRKGWRILCSLPKNNDESVD